MPFETRIVEMAMRPTTPHRRRPSDLDFHDVSPNARFSHSSKRSSAAYSQHSPVSRRFSHGPDDVGDISGSGLGGDDLGNLADELADAWSGEEYEEEDTLEGIHEDDNLGDLDGGAHRANGQATGGAARDIEKTRDSGIDVSSSPTASQKQSMLEPGLNLSPRQMQTQESRQRKQRLQYDGSDYGDDSDLEEAPSISRSLEAEMASIEGLARRGLEANGSAEDTIIERVVDSLRDLGSQSAVENGATRYVTIRSSPKAKANIMQVINRTISRRNPSCTPNATTCLPPHHTNIAIGSPSTARLNRRTSTTFRTSDGLHK